MEYQERGHVHAHIVLWTTNRQHLQNADYVDNVVSAKLPCEADDSELHKLVTTHMLRGPCGPNVTATCMRTVNGERHCCFNFSFEACDVTVISDNGKRDVAVDTHT